MTKEPIEITTTKHYGDINLDFKQKPYHQFSINGKKILSVTAATGIINKPALMFWAVKMMREYLLNKLDDLAKLDDQDEIENLILEGSKQHTIKKDKAADIGTEIHKWAEEYIKAKTKKDIPAFPKEPNAYNGVMAFMKWVEAYKVKFTSSEKVVYSKKYNYAGIMDAEAVIKGKHCVVDFKSSNGIYDEMRYQVSAYQAAAEEESGKKYSGDKWIVRFGKDDGEFEAHQFGDQDKDFKTFLACLTIKKREGDLKNG